MIYGMASDLKLRVVPLAASNYLRVIWAFPSSGRCLDFFAILRFLVALMTISTLKDIGKIYINMTIKIGYIHLYFFKFFVLINY